MLNEHDLKDWIRGTEPIELYNVPRNSVVSFAEDAKRPPDDITPQDSQPFLFRSIDGMYSYCSYLTGKYIGSPFHPAAWTKVYIWSKNNDSK